MENKISIIMPAYNAAQFLCAAVDSVLAQTYGNIELIVVNDGSKDDTGAIIDAYAAKDSRVKAIHKENGGVTSARLAGIKAATGDWIGFVDGDDYIEPDMYERLLKNALEYKADISHCGYRMVFPSGRTAFYYNTGRLVQQDRITGLNDLISGEFVEPGLWNKLFRKNLFGNLLCEAEMLEDIRINEDLLMNYWLFKAAESAVYEDICPYHYLVRDGSATTAKLNENKLKDPLRVAHRILADAPEAVRPAAQKKLARHLITDATRDASQAPELIKPYRMQVRKELRASRKELRTVGFRLKLQLLWAAVWPGSYCWVHKLYAKITGIDKIYDLK